MKSIDYKIVRSEAEWRRYRYERMGVRESTARLCDALKRSAKKRFNCVRRTISPGMIRTAFNPSYDVHKQNIVVSLTSTESRIKTVFPTIYSLTVQTRRPDLIVLWLGNRGTYPRQTIEKIETLGVEVKYREDIGPNTKYHYAFGEYPRDLVVTVDDDIIYHEAMIEELYGAHLKHPDLVVARRVHRIRFNADRSPVKYNDWIWECRDADGPAHDLLATGVGGVLYPPAVMSLKCWENTDFLRVCPACDDIWLKFCQLAHGVRVYAVENSQFSFDVVYYRSQKTNLATENIDRGRNDARVRSCAEYFGMSSNLCEKVLSDDGRGERT